MTWQDILKQKGFRRSEKSEERMDKEMELEQLIDDWGNDKAKSYSAQINELP